MFFTRGVKTIMQQDTYIQRARMFGNRGEEAKNFELTIPNAIMNGLNGNDFNTFFSDILLDSKIPDENLVIKVDQSETFKLRLYGHVDI